MIVANKTLILTFLSVFLIKKQSFLLHFYMFLHLFSYFFPPFLSGLLLRRLPIFPFIFHFPPYFHLFFICFSFIFHFFSFHFIITKSFYFHHYYYSLTTLIFLIKTTNSHNHHSHFFLHNISPNQPQPQHVRNSTTSQALRRSKNI